MGFNPEKVHTSHQLLLINATHVTTGRRMTFSNRSEAGDPDGHPRRDGAMVNNTPMGVVVDAAREFSEDDAMEMVVVMMTPWRDPDGSPDNMQLLPQNFSKAITWALDWVLLASFRERLIRSKPITARVVWAARWGTRSCHATVRFG